ncbi:hypothetical protein E3N88_20855 [Mikania micrantha]|uniref:Reverse transcriptase zinc-binding domain-containing protein n=1 Tax=Mikania micrantha TaxID=192012 RepID=A0A5N6NIA1_9ASTR|nr:hypothetical protein E3N88_20855 [Mikania micrantha]
MGGRRFTCMSSYGGKLSKIDRILLCQKFFDIWPLASLTALPREASDHCPVVLNMNNPDFGAPLFNIYNSWFHKVGFEDTVLGALSRPILYFQTDRVLQLKLRAVKNDLRNWAAANREKEGCEISNLKQKIDDLDLVAEHRCLTDDEMTAKINWKKDLKVGNGSDALFWLDNWLGQGRLKDLYPTLFHNEQNKWCVVKDRVIGGPSDDLKWDWKHFPWHPTIFHMISQCKQNILPFSLKVERDKWVWGENHPMDFSVRAARELIEARLLPLDNYRIPWSRWVPLKVNAFAWRAGLDRIPSKEGLIKRGILINPLCSFCSTHSETTVHLLLRCETASSVWDKVFMWCKAPRDLILTINDLLRMQDS